MAKKPTAAIVHSGTLPLLIRVHAVRHVPGAINIIVTAGKARRRRRRASEGK